MPKIHYTHFPITFLSMGKLATCYGLVVDLLATCKQVRNKLATEKLHNIHNRLLPVPICCGLVVDLLRGSRQLVTGKLV